MTAIAVVCATSLAASKGADARARLSLAEIRSRLEAQEGILEDIEIEYAATSLAGEDGESGGSSPPRRRRWMMKGRREYFEELDGRPVDRRIAAFSGRIYWQWSPRSRTLGVDSGPNMPLLDTAVKPDRFMVRSHKGCLADVLRKNPKVTLREAQEPARLSPSCYVIDTNTRVGLSIWLDPTRGLAPVRVEKVWDGKRDYIWEWSRAKEAIPGFWVPLEVRGCPVSWEPWGGVPRRRCLISIVSVKVNQGITDAAFAPPFIVGARVEDHRKGLHYELGDPSNHGLFEELRDPYVPVGGKEASGLGAGLRRAVQGPSASRKLRVIVTLGLAGILGFLAACYVQERLRGRGSRRM